MIDKYVWIYDIVMETTFQNKQKSDMETCIKEGDSTEETRTELIKRAILDN